LVGASGGADYWASSLARAGTWKSSNEPVMVAARAADRRVAVSAVMWGEFVESRQHSSSADIEHRVASRSS
jgi:acyl-CoA reductase-like NAD-dependent aldehyde dehydrogenase